MKQLAIISCVLFVMSLDVHAASISIDGTQWKIDGEVTHPGAKAEGLLMNARMVNSTFEDRNRDDFNPDENTASFIAVIPEYAKYGIRAFSLNLQGGMPGYEGAVNSAFRPDGELRPSYTERVQRVIEECDKHGIAVILGLFYQRQDQYLEDEEAVKRAVVNAVNWVKASGFKNVVIEIANEYNHGGFDHRIIRSNEGEVELIRLAKQTAPDLLVSTSGVGNGRMADSVAEEADFILIHFNGTSVENIPSRINALKKHNKPIVCNEDDKIGRRGVAALEASVANGCSWGFMHNELNQYQPFEFKGYEDDPAVYNALRRLTE